MSSLFLFLLWLGLLLMDLMRGAECFKGLPDPSCSAQISLHHNHTTTPSHHWLGDEVIYDNWRRLVRRRVQLNSNANDNNTTILDFEIVQQRAPDAAVLIVVWNTATQTTTLIREYMPSRNTFGFGVAAGMVDPHHVDARDAALSELQEECQLTTASPQDLLLLTPEEGVLLDKYCTTRMIVYLAIDPIPTKEAVARDAAEEGMEVVSGVSLADVVRMIHEGEFSVVSSWALLLTLRKLQELDLA